MSTTNVFVYGTLTSPHVQQNVIGRNVKMLPGHIRGYSLTRVRINSIDYPAARKDASGQINGFVLQGLTLNELRQLDIYETGAYKRIKVSLTNGVNAWMYSVV